MKRIFAISLLVVLAICPYLFAADSVTVLVGGRTGSPVIWEAYDNADDAVDFTSTTIPFMGGIIVNSTADANETWTLPAATVGRLVTIYNVSDTLDIILDPAGGETIYYSSDSDADDWLTLEDTRGTMVTLVCYVAGTWAVMGSNGTLTVTEKP